MIGLHPRPRRLTFRRVAAQRFFVLVSHIEAALRAGWPGPLLISALTDRQLRQQPLICFVRLTDPVKILTTGRGLIPVYTVCIYLLIWVMWNLHMNIL